MKFTVHYSRKVRLRSYDMLEISLTKEFDDAITCMEAAYREVRKQVEQWIQEEKARHSQ